MELLFGNTMILTVFINNYNSKEVFVPKFFSVFNLAFLYLFHEWKNISGSAQKTGKREYGLGLSSWSLVSLVDFLQSRWKTTVVLFQIII